VKHELLKLVVPQTQGTRHGEITDLLFGCDALLVVMIIDTGAILWPSVPALPVVRGGVNDVPEHCQQIFVRQHRSVVCDLFRRSPVRNVSNAVLRYKRGSAVPALLLRGRSCRCTLLRTSGLLSALVCNPAGGFR
jgi:hypothetical protein